MPEELTDVISNVNSLGGQFPRDLFQDAAALEESIAQQQANGEHEWQEWPLLATDGDTGFLLELASEGKVCTYLGCRSFSDEQQTHYV